MPPDTTDSATYDAATYDAAWLRTLRRRLLAWYRKNARHLPWRGTRDPYRVWVSEIMLQQTQVATVVPYFERFMAAFPTLAALAAAQEQLVLRLWEGLGYYRRARQLHRAAGVIVREHQGQFPRDLAVVRTLPGIGRYTAGAILSIAFDQPQPIVEANTLRLHSRLLAYSGDPRSARGQQVLWQAATDVLSRRHSGTLNQALMELGATICLPREPHCNKCPVADLCPTHRMGLHDSIPLPARKPAVEHVREAAIVVRRGKSVLLAKRREGERWAGLWDFPRFEMTGPVAARFQRARKREVGQVENLPPPARPLEQRLKELTGLHVTIDSHLTTLKHGVTRFRITLECYMATLVAGSTTRQSKVLRWVPVSKLTEYPLSVTGRKVANLLNSAD
jgi:A/G-specific adenine glycosylase